MKRGLVAWALAAELAALTLAFDATAFAAENEPATPPPKHAPLPGADGVYGRFDGSLALAASAGAELEASQPRGALRLSAHFLWTAGVYARYSDAFHDTRERAPRVMSFGIDLRPLFLPRFALDREQGPAALDLSLDALALTAGAYFAQPSSGGFGDERGFETGLGWGVPLSGEARGPWLEAHAERRFADRGDNAWLFSVALAFHAITWSTEAPAP